MAGLPALALLLDLLAFLVLGGGTYVAINPW
jgi:hypothetical protein